MDTNSTDQSSAASVANQDITNLSNRRQSVDNKSSKVNFKAQLDSPKETVETKDKSKFKKIESRYMQSTQQWVNKRNEADNQSNRSRGNDSRNASRNPTPERRTKKASTPRTNEKSLNVSGISAIQNTGHQVNDKLLKPDRYMKPLASRKSLAPRMLAFAGESSKPVTSRSAPMTAGLEETKKREMSYITSINNSIYLQSLFLVVKAEQALKARREDAKNKINRIWNQSNKVREQILEVQDNVQHLEEMLKAIEILEKKELELKEYLKIREQTDVLFNDLAELIEDQKRLIKIENFSEEDFEAMTGLMAIDFDSVGLKATDKASTNLERARHLWTETTALEKQLEENFKSFGKTVAELDKYHRIERQLKDKNLSLKDLF